MRATNTVVLASTNLDKLAEFRILFRPYPDMELISPEGLIVNIEKLGLVEAHSTYVDNSVAKARLVNQACHYPSLADDTGLEVEALEGKPGIHSFRYAKAKLGQPPLSKSEQYRANVELLLGELREAPAAGSMRLARFVTVLALNIEGILITATGILEGSIAITPKGTHGFGYDSVFIPNGATKTLAEMTDIEKNAISHRGRAVQDLMDKIRRHAITLAKP